MAGIFRKSRFLIFSVFGRLAQILFIMSVARSMEEIQTYIGYKSRSHFMSNVLKPLLEAGTLKTTTNSKSKHTKYIATIKID